MKASSKEIVISALKSKRSDRPPIMLLTSLHAIRVLGLTVPEVRVSSELNFKAQAKALEIYEYDNVFQYWDLAMFLELMGGKVRPIKDSSPSIVEPLIKGPEHLSSLKIPDLKAESPLKESLKCLEKLVKTFGDDIAICTGAVGPFTFAGVLRGIESFMVDLSKNKDFALKLIDWSYEFQEKYVDLLCGIGALIINVSDPMSTFIPPIKFDEFVKPYLINIFKKIRQAGKYSILHVCGNVSKILDRMVSTEADCLWIDQHVSINEARKIVGNKCLMGNVDPVNVLMMGKKEDVRDEAIRCIKEGLKEGEFILSAGCEVPFHTPFENIKELVRAAKTYKA